MNSITHRVWLLILPLQVSELLKPYNNCIKPQTESAYVKKNSVIKNKTANCALRDRETHFTKAFFTLKMSYSKSVKCSSIYAHYKSTAFPMPIFTELTNAQQHCVHIFTELTNA